ncbi:O-antigen ligase family protein [Parapedobacter tibetensis]|uniref:O-antigen ligase family protein n=1 Tax=Parapedobacter tibetensis TaxID=2972951 RepID=UPI00214D54C6|nr:O-antigen ligase family protein [Parapedobacter tibetensis]
MIRLFKISFVLLLFNAFLVSTKLPNGLFTAKELGLYFVVSIASLCAAALLFWRKSEPFRLGLLDFLVLAYLLILPVVHLLAFKFISFPAILVQTAYGMAYLTIRTMAAALRPAVLVNAVAECVTLVLCFHLATALAQHIGIMPSYYPMFGATGMFFNPGPFAIFTVALMACVLVACGVNLMDKQYAIALFQLVLFVVGCYFVALSLSRSAWIGLLGGSIVPLTAYLAVRFQCRLYMYRKWLYAGGAIVLLLLIPLGYWLYGLKKGSADGRLLVWRTTGGMVGDYWYSGVGVGNFAPNYIHYQAAYLRSSAPASEEFGRLAGDSRYAFNDLLQTVAETGLVGGILLLSIIGLAMYSAWKVLRKESCRRWVVLGSCGLGGAMITILVAGLTAYPLQMTSIALLFWMLVVLLASLSGRTGNNYSMTMRYALAILLILGAAVYTYYGTKRVGAYLGWLQEKTERSAGITDTLPAARLMLWDDVAYLSHRADLHRKRGDYRKAARLLERVVRLNPAPAFHYVLGSCYEHLADTGKALASYRLVGTAIPNLLGPKYREAMLYHRLGDIETFRIKAQEALIFKPKVMNGEVVEMQSELRGLLRGLDQDFPIVDEAILGEKGKMKNELE